VPIKYTEKEKREDLYVPIEYNGKGKEEKREEDLYVPIKYTE
jgi:hypothetical protein